MISNERHYSEEEIDYLREMMNIAAGNAVTAFSQLLQCEVDIELPNIYILPVTKVSSIFKDPDMPVLCVRMEMLGDVKGTLFFIVPDDQKKNLLALVKKAMPGALGKTYKVDTHVLEEIGNIIAGVFLTAIHDFSRLNIYHTVPALAIDMVRSLLDETVSASATGAKEVLIIENEFIIKEGNVRTIMFVMPVMESIDTIFSSVIAARKKMGMG